MLAKKLIWKQSKGFTPLEPSRPKAAVSRPPKAEGGSLTGFTLIELTVALALFLLVGGAALNLLVSSISAQRYSLASQGLVNQASYVTEYMTRALRQAEREEADPPVCLSATGLSYELIRSGEGIRFIDVDGRCREFFLENEKIKELEITAGVGKGLAKGKGKGKGKGPTPGAVELTSQDLTVTSLQFSIRGASQADNTQPQVTIADDFQEPTIRFRVRLQTTVSQRNLDL